MLAADPRFALLTPILLVDTRACVQDLNPAAASWLAGTPRRLLGQGLSLLAPDLYPLLERGRNRPLRARQQRFRGLDGETRFADVWIPLPEHEAHLQLELHPVEEFRGADPLATLPAALHAALKGLAHEVKNPLAGLKGAAQLLARRTTEADNIRYLDVILAECERLGTLVDRLLDPAASAVHAPLNVHAVLERVRLLAEAEAGWGVRIERDYDPSLPEILGDADRLAQALLNLVRNALQSGASDVALRTRAEIPASIGEQQHRLGIRLEIADNGRGVPEDLAERIFLPLVSGRAEGSGLGLSLAQQVAREHRGTLAYRSRPGHTVFTLLLPVEDTRA